MCISTVVIAAITGVQWDGDSVWELRINDMHLFRR